MTSFLRCDPDLDAPAFSVIARTGVHSQGQDKFQIGLSVLPRCVCQFIQAIDEEMQGRKLANKETD
ncbi:hypothetical protein CTA1_9842 [Colletotrichum tanaceti]|uniref:Uncharacterized protein n=1 Tax=Colletotrichum tanaceti TaxID=1306861 RepID=A0A4U6XFQ6_9PEZI|nr:hypothetical protein CTA1_9842 [Colletotrichum tanaceti]